MSKHNRDVTDRFFPAKSAAPAPARPEHPVTREPSKSSERHVGRLISWRSDRGFGWLRPESGGPDVFVGDYGARKSGIANMVEGSRVEFSIAVSDNGKLSACDLRVL